MEEGIFTMASNFYGVHLKEEVMKEKYCKEKGKHYDELTYQNYGGEFCIDENYYNWLEERLTMCEANSNAMLADVREPLNVIDGIVYMQKALIEAEVFCVGSVVDIALNNLIKQSQRCREHFR